jgi:phosphohistidine phosphatase SixA
MRHAAAPGGGDPPGFQLGDCATQRNLSEGGRQQARRIGEAFAREGVAVAQALSSRWCRALDTARLAFPEVANPDATLDSFFAQRSSGEEQTRLLRALVEGWRGPGVLALVTHQVNVTALTGVFPAEGEVLVLRPGAGGFELVGRLRP